MFKLDIAILGLLTMAFGGSLIIIVLVIYLIQNWGVPLS